MDPVEKHARIRAHDDEQMRIDAHAFVTKHFGGDYRRAMWFLSELTVMNNIAWKPEDEKNQIYSIRRDIIEKKD